MHGVGDLLEVERERLAALIRVVETVLDCGCWKLSKCVSERCGGASKILNVANNDLLIKASPRRMSELERDWREELLECKVKKCACEKGAGIKQNCKVANNDLRHQTRHTLVRFNVGCKSVGEKIIVRVC